MLHKNPSSPAPKIFKTALAAAVTGLACAPIGALASQTLQAPVNTDRATELQRQIDLLGQEVQKLKIGEASIDPTADRTQFGYGPGISKVYRKNQGISLGGYAEILMENFRNGFDGPGRRVSPGMAFNPSDGVVLT